MYKTADYNEINNYENRHNTAKKYRRLYRALSEGGSENIAKAQDNHQKGCAKS